MIYGFFISYAHRGDNGSRETMAVWVARLHVELESDLRRLSGRDLEIFFERALRGLCGVTATLRLALARLELPALTVLQIASPLAPDAVALPWVREIAGRNQPELATNPATGDTDPWTQLIRGLIGMRLPCEGDDDLRLSLAELATPIGFEFNDDEKINANLQFERTRHELKKLADTRAPHRCLLLLDNADRHGLLEPAQVARRNGGDWQNVLAATRLGENELPGADRDRSFLAIGGLPSDEDARSSRATSPKNGGRKPTAIVVLP